MTVEEILLNKAKELGAVSAGIIEAKRPEGLDRFYRWLDDGCHADMDYLSARRDAYADANSVLPGVRSMIVMAVAQDKGEPGGVSPRKGENCENQLNLEGGNGAKRNYAFGEAEKESCENTTMAHSSRFSPLASRFSILGRIASYASGEDYHNRIRRLLKQLGQVHRDLFPNGKCRGVVDTAPILEKDAALTAGLGYIGRNTLLQCGEYGSRVNLAVLLSTEVLKPTPGRAGRFVSCDGCRKCIDACPVGALSDSGLDARRCLSYWLIEHRGPIPDEIAIHVGNRLFGCDVCQDVCPNNPPGNSVYIDVNEIFNMTEDEFKTRFGDTPVARCGLDGLKRNAKIVKSCELRVASCEKTSGKSGGVHLRERTIASCESFQPRESADNRQPNTNENRFANLATRNS